MLYDDVFVTAFTKNQKPRVGSHICLKPMRGLYYNQKKAKGGFYMKLRSKKRYLAVTKEDVSKFIEYILIARNAYIDDDVPVEDVDKILFRFLKLNKKLRA